MFLEISALANQCAASDRIRTEHFPSQIHVSSITSRRILERDYTHYLNPGNLLGGEKGPTSGPWEIHALCYHSRLLVENYQYKKNDEKTREQKVEDVEKYRSDRHCPLQTS